MLRRMPRNKGFRDQISFRPLTFPKRRRFGLNDEDRCSLLFVRTCIEQLHRCISPPSPTLKENSVPTSASWTLHFVCPRHRRIASQIGQHHRLFYRLHGNKGSVNWNSIGSGFNVGAVSARVDESRVFVGELFFARVEEVVAFRAEADGDGCGAHFCRGWKRWGKVATAGILRNVRSTSPIEVLKQSG